MVLGIATLAMFLGGSLHLSGLLICMTAGFVVENSSEHGSELVAAAERFSTPVYVLFFTLAGASIDVPTLASTWGLALALVLARLVATALGTYIGHRTAGDEAPLRRWGWTAYIGQAGVSLGLATLVRDTFPSFGPALYNLAIATVAINQLIGPVLFKLGLTRTGEARTL